MICWGGEQPSAARLAAYHFDRDATVGRIAFAPIPNVKPTTDIALFAGYALGPVPGFAVGAVAALASNVFFGQGREELDVRYDGPDCAIGFNAKYLIELLSEIETPEVQLELNGELDPGLLRPLDDKQGVGNQYLGVIMPMRL